MLSADAAAGVADHAADIRNKNVFPASLFVLKIKMNCSEKYIPYCTVKLNSVVAA